MASGARASSLITVHLEITALLTEKLGFSVVAPIRVIAPDSDSASRASCWALFHLWISSMKSVVRLPVRRSVLRARTSSTVSSSFPVLAALRERNDVFVVSLTTRAKLVFPHPGGPQRRRDGSRSESKARRKVPFTSLSWPTRWSIFWGRMRSASGADSFRWAFAVKGPVATPTTAWPAAWGRVAESGEDACVPCTASTLVPSALAPSPLAPSGVRFRFPAEKGFAPSVPPFVPS